MKELQKAIYEKLIADNSISAILGIGSVVDQPVERDKLENSVFPYVVIGDDSLSDWDTDGTTGYIATCAIRCWSINKSYKEVKELTMLVKRALHNQQLTIDGHVYCGSRVTSVNYSRDSDGITKQGILSLRLHTYETT